MLDVPKSVDGRGWLRGLYVDAFPSGTLRRVAFAAEALAAQEVGNSRGTDRGDAGFLANGDNEGGERAADRIVALDAVPVDVAA